MTRFLRSGIILRMHSCDYCRPECAWAHPLNMKTICRALETPYPRPPVVMTVLSAISSVITLAGSFWFSVYLDRRGGMPHSFGILLGVVCGLAFISLTTTIDAWWQWRKKTDGRYLYQESAILYANGYSKCFEALDVQTENAENAALKAMADALEEKRD